MAQIPTAEEFLESQHKTVPNIEFDIRKVMIQFAKLHVEAALKEAANSVVIQGVNSKCVINSLILTSDDT